MSLLKILEPEVEATVQRLRAKKFKPDPIAGEHFSRIVSVMSSAYKRHGFIIERAILEQLKFCPDFEVWEDSTFQVPATADHIVDSAIKDPEHIYGTETSYREGHRTLQVDAIVFNKLNGEISAYEIKRGSGLHDAGKRRSILRDLLCLQILLKSYAELRGYEVTKARAHIIFYYGMCSIKKPFSLTKDELDEHFGWPVSDAVEEVNGVFRERLFSILASPT
ncbi:hypothetical protein [Roseobacter sp. OBYS 0001]|uniref:hypothetical protein n=1 Tax=Roseobacter sp. OBYS 0001 TaxID=882651 RepID=UPI001BC603B0|nr:hypothetical protein [Roseobacter sp. OBYS 0001]GIT89224.1 hypothetical protein ROBYS_42400 [Roseobacter sp. OBYS 0001]